MIRKRRNASKWIGIAFVALTSLFTYIGEARAEAPAGYYDALNGKSGAELIKAVKSVGFKNHKAISYGTSTWDAFLKTDVRVVNGKECWWDMYSSNNVPVSSGHPGMNIEHSVANSWWNHTNNDAYKDIVHLNPSDQDANSRKSNYPLGECSTVTWDNGVTFVGKPVSGQGGGSSMVYEPCDEYKGDFARVFMYMFTVYRDIAWMDKYAWMYDLSSDLMFQPWAYQLLLKWSAKDPVNQKERDRNDGIQATQGNRNPFIDLPDLADYIWGAKRGEAYVVEGAHDPDPWNPDDPENPEKPETPDAKAGTYLLVSSNSDLLENEDYIIVDKDGKYGLASTLNGKYFERTKALSVNNGVITALADDIAVLNLEKGASGWYVKVMDTKGASKGYMGSTTAKTMTLSSSKTQDIKISVSLDETTFDFDSAGRLLYNPSSPRFTTYNSQQTPLQLFKKVKESSSVLEIVNSAPLRVKVIGNSIIAPEGAHIYDMHGVEVSGVDLMRGIYVVYDSQKGKSIKIRI